ncbi:hypothetical protein [Bradyrhizobium elkanii]|uniref:hypothetical protein n=1 Tax=Bradyrhizobium elkanii TaxID=29448 RepID=UPI002227FEEE|nr:hypothetical protein [Bradyrhizobium elkanii]MCW2227234.1 hypothetical protein [Bradyrhizobium elkanii]
MITATLVEVRDDGQTPNKGTPHLFTQLPAAKDRIDAFPGLMEVLYVLHRPAKLVPGEESDEPDATVYARFI